MTADPPTVLVVDDEADVTEVYAMWLDDEYEVLTATGGPEALETMTDEVDVVLLDRRMPEMTGDEVLERLREDGYECKVAMVTAVDPDFDIVDLPFDAYLTKPIMPDDLNRAVDRLAYLDDLDFEHEEETREGLRLEEKREALAREKHEEELRRNEEFEKLTDRLDALREDVRETVEAINARSGVEGIQEEVAESDELEVADGEETEAAVADPPEEATAGSDSPEGATAGGGSPGEEAEGKSERQREIEEDEEWEEVPD